MTLVTFGLISVGLNVLMFVPAFIFKTDKLTDISYALTFAALALLAFGFSDKAAVHGLLLVMVFAWAVRLGGFLFYRIQKTGRDKRFDDKRDNFGKFLSFWLLQGISVAIILIAGLLAWDGPGQPLGLVAWAGAVIFLVGLMLEATADWQKFNFSRSSKAGGWIDSGVWRISRHPNYLGEVLVWISVYLVAFGSLTGAGRWLGLVSPLYIIGLLLFVSGVPLLEKAADKKWGSEPGYRRYKREVPVLVPSLKSLRRVR